MFLAIVKRISECLYLFINVFVYFIVYSIYFILFYYVSLSHLSAFIVKTKSERNPLPHSFFGEISY